MTPLICPHCGIEQPPNPPKYCAQCGRILPRDPSAVPPPPPPPDPEVQVESQLVTLRTRLVELTPRLVFTPLLIVACATVFVLMLISGVSWNNPQVPDILKWGANFGVLSLSGEWWRFATCVFVHIGLWHILFNMIALADGGPLLERMVGNVGFLLLYVISGLCGSLASTLWDPLVASAGASGAIFGVFGALVAILMKQRDIIPPEAMARLRNTGLMLLVINVILGVTVPNIGHAAHIGGFVAGFLGGLVIRHRLVPEAVAGRTGRNIALLVLGSIVIVGGYIAAKELHRRAIEWHLEFERFSHVEDKSLKRYQDAFNDVRANRLANAEFSRIIEEEILPPWKDCRQRLEKISELRPKLEEFRRKTIDYLRLREEGWGLLVVAIRENDGAMMNRADQKFRAADDLAGRMKRDGGQ